MFQSLSPCDIGVPSSTSSSSLSLERRLVQSLRLKVVFIHLFPLSKNVCICCLSVFKLGGDSGLLMCLDFYFLFLMLYLMVIYIWLLLPVNHPCQMMLLGSHEKGWPLGCLSRTLLGPAPTP